MTHVTDAAVDGVLLSLKLTDDSLAKERCFKGRGKNTNEQLSKFLHLT